VTNYYAHFAGGTESLDLNLVNSGHTCRGTASLCNSFAQIEKKTKEVQKNMKTRKRRKIAAPKKSVQRPVLLYPSNEVEFLHPLNIGSIVWTPSCHFSQMLIAIATDATSFAMSCATLHIGPAQRRR